MRRVRTVSVVVLIAGAVGVLAMIGCRRNPHAQSRGSEGALELHVHAAASLADAFREVGGAFERANAGAKVMFDFAGSNQLRTRLEQGAPGDVFASADQKQMDAAVSSKVVNGATVRVLCTNRLALIVPRGNEAGIKELADVARPGVKIVVADKAVPVGSYTRKMLDKAGAEPVPLGAAFVAAFDRNTVSREENLAAVVAKVALAEADAGIAYASDAAGGDGAKIAVIALPPALEERAEYTIGITTSAASADFAGRFMEFVRGPTGASILAKRGFSPAGAGTP